MIANRITNKIATWKKTNSKQKLVRIEHLSAGKIFWQTLKMPVPVSEYKFHPKRKWRIDYVWIDVKLAVEIEGGVWKQGRHNRALGFINDIEKYNALTEEGWHLLRYIPKNIDYSQIQKVYEKLLHVEHKL
jgi:very-short-patch-repair endonuclease